MHAGKAQTEKRLKTELCVHLNESSVAWPPRKVYVPT